jgi:membrane fusion protein, macrolide-specific efflux system
MVIANNIKPGQTVTQQEVLVVLSDQLIIRAKVDETDISHIAKKQKVIVTIDSFPNTKINAVVKHIAFEAITENSVTMYEIEIEPLERPDFLRSGMSATVDFVLVEKNKVTMIPENAVYKKNEEENYILLYNGEETKPKKVNIKIGLSHDAKTEVLEGVQPGDILLIQTEKSNKAKKEKASNPFAPSFPSKGRRK